MSGALRVVMLVLAGYVAAELVNKVQQPETECVE